MSLFLMVKQKYINYVKLRDSKFEYNRKQQKDILDSMPEPKDNIERSYNQFRCQFIMHSMNKIFLQISAFFMLYYKMLTTPRKTSFIEKCDLVCMLVGLEASRVPRGLIQQYENVIYYTDMEHYVLNKEDYMWFVKNIKQKYPFEFFFQMKIFLWMTHYRYLLDSYNPKTIATHSEYSCGCSAMTEFCHIHQVKHVDFMHGDKVWCIRDSFFRFDECYVWHEHYKKMCISLKAFPEQFIIEVPPVFCPEEMDVKQEDKVDYCYYFQDESHEEMDRILSCLTILERRGNRIRVRLHPRWSDGEYIAHAVKGKGIEIEPTGVDINYSILTSGHAVSKYSTVLLQSHFLKIPVIIDDCSNVHKYKQIAEYDYIMLSLEHTLLSKELGSDFTAVERE